LKKQEVVKKIVAALTEELAGYMRSAKAAHAEATDEQSKAENKYDTRGLEASYLARGQSRQAAEVIEGIQLFESLPLRDFAPGDAIELGALVELERGKERAWYFVGPRGGGTEIECDGHEVTVITPPSPLGQELAGRKQGDRVQIAAGRTSDRYVVARVQ
jgi:transcription elongation GreA/GreB family factor